ncbi:MAG: hypothetical protein WA120_07645 [Candidatus Hydromicrobium sp.]
MGIIRPIKKIPMTTKYKIGNSILELSNGDITIQNTEAIANAANRRLSLPEEAYQVPSIGQRDRSCGKSVKNLEAAIPVKPN